MDIPVTGATGFVDRAMVHTTPYTAIDWFTAPTARLIHNASFPPKCLVR